MEQTILNYRVIIEPDKRTGTNEPCFVAYCPTLGIADDGDTVEEALAAIKEGITCWLEGLTSDGEPIPAPDNITQGFVTTASVKAPRKARLASL